MYPQKRNCAASVPISTFMVLWGIYIFPVSVHIFSCSRIGRLIVGIYKSLTDTRMWKLGTRVANYFSGNICLKFSVLCLCNASYRKGVCRSRDSWTYNFFEVFGHNLESFQTWGFCMDFLNHRDGGVVFYQVFLLSLLQCTRTIEQYRNCKSLREFEVKEISMQSC